MTNGKMQNKVRIYDLARDLGRENQDVLAICQRLGIAYKSHSSTISQEEADQIRDAFQRGLSAGRKKPKIQTQQQAAAASSNRQQILEVRRPPVGYQPPSKDVPELVAVQPKPPEILMPVAIPTPVILEPVAVLPSIEVPATPEPEVVVETPVVVVPEPIVVVEAPPKVVVPEPMKVVAAEPPKMAIPQAPRPQKQEREEERQVSRMQPKPSKGSQPTNTTNAPARPTRVAAQPIGGQPAAPSRPGGGIAKKGSGLQKAGAARPNANPMRRREEREVQVVEEQPKILVLGGNVSVQELAQRMNVQTTEIIKTLFMRGVMVNINQTLEQATAEMVAKELGFEIQTEEAVSKATKTEMLDIEDLDELETRPPVITIMGHVDHGKTSLLDAIRSARVAEGEAGGITQHIGAYQIEVPTETGPRKLVFLDTPGHEAFTAMRARGAKVTDITILVVAADDGVKPQTIEAISHAKAAGVPILVAINKIDKPDASPDRVKQELTEYDLVSEEWGGKTVMVPVSARQRIGLDLLLESILLVADYELELQANPNREAKGTIIEAHLDKSRGPVATALIQNGTLRVGDSLVVGSIYGKVRALYNDRGEKVDFAPPSMPVEVLGLREMPQAGDEFDVYLDDSEAQRIARERSSTAREGRLAQQMTSRRISLGAMSTQAQEGELKELNIILRGDVQGSVEAIRASLDKIPQDKIQLRLLQAAAGEVSNTDIDLAAASNAVILAFNTIFSASARQAAEQAGVDVREYDVIYKLLEDIQLAMEGLLDPELIEEALGGAEVRQVFTVGKGQVAGCYVKEGKLLRNAQLRIRRGKEVVFEGHIDSLKRFKEDAKEVATGFECGVGCDKFNNWQESDMIECFRMVTQKRTLL
jgi:translation initiation factor IF-2